MKSITFSSWWSKHKADPEKRFRNFKLLTKEEQKELKQSFYNEGWDQLFWQNERDKLLDWIKKTFLIDLLDLKIKVRKNQSFLINKRVWDKIEERIRSNYDIDALLCGLTVCRFGESFYIVKRKQ